MSSAAHSHSEEMFVLFELPLVISREVPAYGSITFELTDVDEDDEKIVFALKALNFDWSLASEFAVVEVEVYKSRHKEDYGFSYVDGAFQNLQLHLESSVDTIRFFKIRVKVRGESQLPIPNLLSLGETLHKQIGIKPDKLGAGRFVLCSNQQHLFYVHSVAFEHLSSVLIQEFEQNTNQLREGRPKQLDCSTEALSKILCFVYLRNELPDLGKLAAQMIHVSDELKLEGLTTLCVRSLQITLDSDLDGITFDQLLPAPLAVIKFDLSGGHELECKIMDKLEELCGSDKRKIDLLKDQVLKCKELKPAVNAAHEAKLAALKRKRSDSPESPAKKKAKRGKRLIQPRSTGFVPLSARRCSPTTTTSPEPALSPARMQLVTYHCRKTFPGSPTQGREEVLLDMPDMEDSAEGVHND